MPLSWVRRFLRSGAPRTLDRATVLNDGLALAMDWGEGWLAPIQDRLRERHPRLTKAELDGFDADCREAMRFGHETVYALVRQSGKNADPAAFAASFGARYPWASAQNTTRLFNQGLYYAWKTGGPANGS
jgi:hypothetical protein